MTATTVTLDADQQRYVIRTAHGYSCLGFAVARDHANQIAARLNRPELVLDAQDFGDLAGYGKYEMAIHAWGQSLLHEETYFDPGTDPKAARGLKRCRKTGAKVRLILGDPATGETWLDACDVVGRVGRSGGQLKVPLLVEPGDDGGGAILTACLLAVIAWESRKYLFRHPNFRQPDLSIQRAQNQEFPWEVLHGNALVARFSDIGKAGAYVAFMRGETVEPRIFV
ncbi:MAG: hypothetical protein LBU72_02160 [Burkholderiaceae bacterium]|jgi:hypothetical protein|nr:hypothetical protein [Burkholderiaceae bacterium]